MTNGEGHGMCTPWGRALGAVLAALLLVAGCTAPGPTTSGSSSSASDSSASEAPDGGAGQAPPTSPSAPGGGADEGAPARTGAADGFSGREFIRSLNTALHEQDRAAFFARVGQGAEAALSLWWDNMDVLGMRSAGISVQSGTLLGVEPGHEETLTVRLGALTAGTPQAHADTRYLSAGTYLVGASSYQVTVSVDSHDRGRITAFEPAGPATPWDEGPLTAVTTDHVLVAGMAQEEDLVRRVAGMVDEPASWVLNQYRQGLGHLPIERFTLFATGKEGRVGTWFQTGTVNSELAGFTVPQHRLSPAPGLDERFATDTATPWAASVVTVGPKGVANRSALQSLTAHEFTHAVNFARLPVPEDRSRVISEGWAEYQQEQWDNGTFAPAGSWRDTQLRSCLDSGHGYPTDADFDAAGTQIYCGYVLSASVYAYAAEQGVDVFALSGRARLTGESLIEASRDLDSSALTKDGWSQWAHERFA